MLRRNPANSSEIRKNGVFRATNGNYSRNPDYFPEQIASGPRARENKNAGDIRKGIMKGALFLEGSSESA